MTRVLLVTFLAVGAAVLVLRLAAGDEMARTVLSVLVTGEAAR